MPTLAILGLILISSFALATIIGFPSWQNGLSSITIDKGESVYFDMTLTSANPSISYTVTLHNAATQALISTVETGAISNDAADIQVIITPSDYNDVGGIYTVRIIASDSIGHSVMDTSLSLTVTNLAPIISNIPDFTIEEGTSHIINLNNYVTDADDAIPSLIWTVTGNSNILVSIDSSNIATITSSLGWTGSETLTFTVTDLSSDSDSDTVSATVVPIGSLDADETETTINVKDLSVESFGDGMLMIRNNGNEMEDVKVEVNIEAPNAPTNIFRFDITSNTVKYFDLNTEGLSGDYLARVKMSSEDSSASGYMILSV